ncbi:hypothetical protein [Micromonospora coerulea]|uniref:hypothetical protein n=1 Tax=Micromonospora coerulea TaxID=47856 RepID=UPI0019046389|nr:hypothetical protein [Micromonospora veneta]
MQAIAELAGLDATTQRRRAARGGDVRLITIPPAFHGLTVRDVELARRIAAVARELGPPAGLSCLQNVQVIIDALVCPEVLPFWRAPLGYEFVLAHPSLIEVLPCRTSAILVSPARLCSQQFTRPGRRTTPPLKLGLILASPLQPIEPMNGSRTPGAATCPRAPAPRGRVARQSGGYLGLSVSDGAACWGGSTSTKPNSRVMSCSA